MIISGGNNVYPREVEDVIVTHPDVAHVVRGRHPRRVLGRGGARGRGSRTRHVRRRRPELIEHCAKHLAGYKKPKAVDFVDELPTSAYGKVLRREVRARYWGERAIAGGNRGA